MDNDRKHSLKSFSKASKKYNEHASIQIYSAKELISRLEFFKMAKPNRILDLGCGTGILSNLMQQYFLEAEMICLDWSQSMLEECLKGTSCIPLVADAQSLPLEKKSIDIVISNAMMQWSPDLLELSQEVQRVLKDDGLFIFATFGPSTLNEWRRSWLLSDGNYNHTNEFLDMHDVAETLLRGGLCDPVVDVENVTLKYSSVFEVAKNIKGVGSRRLNNEKKGLITARKWKDVEQNHVKDGDGKYPITWEVIQGHCFKGKPRMASKLVANEITFNRHF